MARRAGFRPTLRLSIGEPVSRILYHACAWRRPLILAPRRRGAPCSLPAGRMRRAGAPCLFGLAPGGVYHAVRVTTNAVRSYRTVSPLPVTAEAVHRRSVLCGTFPRITPGWRYQPPCPVESGLSSLSASKDAPARPPGSPGISRLWFVVSIIQERA